MSNNNASKLTIWWQLLSKSQYIILMNVEEERKYIKNSFIIHLRIYYKGFIDFQLTHVGFRNLLNIYILTA